MESLRGNQSAAHLVSEMKEPPYISLMSNITAVLSDDDGDSKES